MHSGGARRQKSPAAHCHGNHCHQWTGRHTRARVLWPSTRPFTQLGGGMKNRLVSASGGSLRHFLFFDDLATFHSRAPPPPSTRAHTMHTHTRTYISSALHNSGCFQHPCNTRAVIHSSTHPLGCLTSAVLSTAHPTPSVVLTRSRTNWQSRSRSRSRPPCPRTYTSWPAVTVPRWSPCCTWRGLGIAGSACRIGRVCPCAVSVYCDRALFTA